MQDFWLLWTIYLTGRLTWANALFNLLTLLKNKKKSCHGDRWELKIILIVALKKGSGCFKFLHRHGSTGTWTCSLDHTLCTVYLPAYCIDSGLRCFVQWEEVKRCWNLGTEMEFTKLKKLNLCLSSVSKNSQILLGFWDFLYLWEVEMRSVRLVEIYTYTTKLALNPTRWTFRINDQLIQKLHIYIFGRCPQSHTTDKLYKLS